MSNDNNDLFDSVESHVDAQSGHSNSDSTPASRLNDPQFIGKLSSRNKLQTEWNRAKKFEIIKKQTKKIQKQKKTPNQKLRYFSYAAAACLLIFLAIPGYKYFGNQNSMVLEVNETEVKSSVTFFDSRYRQVSPINGQLFGDESILFEWESALDVKTNLIITNTETGKVAFTQPINSEAKQYKLSQYLGKGKYSWRLEGFVGEMIFVMN
jgi:hypothetical protein